MATDNDRGPSLPFMMSSIAMELLILNTMRQQISAASPAVTGRPASADEPGRATLFVPAVTRALSMVAGLSANMTDGPDREAVRGLAHAISPMVGDSHGDLTWQRVMTAWTNVQKHFPDVAFA